MTNFGSSKADLNLKYRLGLEHALARADFLNAPNITLLQAFVLFLCLVRRHDSPRFVWMMTGLAIRMAQYLGLQRDGTHFGHLSPFEIEMRRRLWVAVGFLDVRASEDQGTDLTITSGSFDTRMPLNINDGDIDPQSKHMPTEREGFTDMSFSLIYAGICDTTRQLMASSVKHGVAAMEDQNRLLHDIYQRFEQGYFQYTEKSGNILYWVTVSVARLVIAKLTLIVSLPVLFSSPSNPVSDETRTKLLVSAIEVAEYNHALNAEQACRQWRWVYQTHTHWHAIVYLLIEVSRRSWAPIAERAWVALHSSWLMPARTHTDKNLLIWVPLRRLMNKARKHRAAELDRLRADPQAVATLELEDQKHPVPSSSGPFSAGSSVDIFRERWRQLVAKPTGHGEGSEASTVPDAGQAGPWMHTAHSDQSTAKFNSTYKPDDPSFSMPLEPATEQSAGQNLEATSTGDSRLATTTDITRGSTLDQTTAPAYDPFSTVPTDWPDGRTMGPGLTHWLWADADPSADVLPNLDLESFDVNMGLDGEVNWYEWVQSAQGMDWDV